MGMDAKMNHEYLWNIKRQLMMFSPIHQPGVMKENLSCSDSAACTQSDVTT